MDRVRNVVELGGMHTVQRWMASLDSRSALLLLLRDSAKKVITANVVALAVHANPHLLMRVRRSHSSTKATGHAWRGAVSEWVCG